MNTSAEAFITPVRSERQFLQKRAQLIQRSDQDRGDLDKSSIPTTDEGKYNLVVELKAAIAHTPSPEEAVAAAEYQTLRLSKLSDFELEMFCWEAVLGIIELSKGNVARMAFHSFQDVEYQAYPDFKSRWSDFVKLFKRSKSAVYSAMTPGYLEKFQANPALALEKKGTFAKNNKRKSEDVRYRSTSKKGKAKHDGGSQTHEETLSNIGGDESINHSIPSLSNHGSPSIPNPVGFQFEANASDGSPSNVTPVTPNTAGVESTMHASQGMPSNVTLSNPGLTIQLAANVFQGMPSVPLAAPNPTSAQLPANVPLDMQPNVTLPPYRTHQSIYPLPASQVYRLARDPAGVEPPRNFSRTPPSSDVTGPWMLPAQQSSPFDFGHHVRGIESHPSSLAPPRDMLKPSATTNRDFPATNPDLTQAMIDPAMIDPAMIDPAIIDPTTPDHGSH